MTADDLKLITCERCGDTALESRPGSMHPDGWAQIKFALDQCQEDGPLICEKCFEGVETWLDAVSLS